MREDQGFKASLSYIDSLIYAKGDLASTQTQPPSLTAAWCRTRVAGASLKPGEQVAWDSTGWSSSQLSS